MSAGDDTRRTWGAVADVVGHCVLVFVFVPTLVELPRWLAFEAQNPLNRRDPVVLTFLPLRGLVLLLTAFSSGLAQGMLAGVLAGLLLSRYGRGSTSLRRLAIGALGGALATCVVVGMMMARGPREGADIAARGGQVVFEIGLGMVCGMIAAAGAARLLEGDQRWRAMASASHQ